MKRTRLLSFVFVGAAILIGSQNLYTNITQPPTGHTGAPGEATCATAGCHSGSLIQNSSTISLSGINGAPAPSTLYNLILSAGSNSNRYGFSITAVDEAGNAVGDFSLSNPNLTSLQTGANGRQYVGHLNATSNPGFTFRWTSPATLVDPIYFYVASNPSNDDGSTTGDNIYLRTFRLTSSGLAPFDIVGIQNIDALTDKSIMVFPNPISDRLNLSFNIANSSDVKADIYNLNGQLVKPLIEENLSFGSHDRSFNVAGELSTGIYLVKMTIDGADYFKKIVVE